MVVLTKSTKPCISRFIVCNFSEDETFNSLVSEDDFIVLFFFLVLEIFKNYRKSRLFGYHKVLDLSTELIR